VTLFGFGNRGRVISARESPGYFARRNGITDPPTTEALAQPEGSVASAKRTVWSFAAGARGPALHDPQRRAHAPPAAPSLPAHPGTHAHRSRWPRGDLALLRATSRVLKRPDQSSFPLLVMTVASCIRFLFRLPGSDLHAWAVGQGLADPGTESPPMLLPGGPWTAKRCIFHSLLGLPGPAGGPYPLNSGNIP
jgi:hypothetical protein